MYENVLPQNYIWRVDMENSDEKGLALVQRGSTNIIANAMILVEKCTYKEDFRLGFKYKTITLSYIGVDGKRIGDLQTFDEGEIINCKFTQKRPIGVIIKPRCQIRASEVYCYTIQKQLEKLPISKIYIGNGWYNRKYYWQDNDQVLLKNEIHSSSVTIAKLLSERNIVICATVLAAIHGPIKQIMRATGIEHDFVTVIAGESGIGKSSIAKILCDYHPNAERSFSLGSNRKELARFLEKQFDTTVVIDDFCTTASDRIHKQQLQTLSGIIQLVDGAKLLVDENSKHKLSGNAHFIVTCEMLINNISTLNRCFVIMMDEALPQEVWNQLERIRVSETMFDFMFYFTDFLQSNYDKILKQVKQDYDNYLSNAPCNLLLNETSRNRIITTRAILLTLKDVLLSYFRYLRMGLRLMDSVDKALEASIQAGIVTVANQIESVRNEENYTKYISRLYTILSYIDYGTSYYLASNEKSYCKKRRKKDMNCIGFYNDDSSGKYISFEPSIMCEILKEYGADTDITPTKLGKELSHYGLAHIDSQGKLCSYWHTEKRYYHVDKSALRDLISEVLYGLEI